MSRVARGSLGASQPPDPVGLGEGTASLGCLPFVAFAGPRPVRRCVGDLRCQVGGAIVARSREGEYIALVEER